MSEPIDISLGEVAASIVLVALAAAISVWRRAELESDIAWATARSFLQLTAIGFVISAIFDSDSVWLSLGLLSVMVGFGAFTAGRRARTVPGATLASAIGLAVAAVTTLGLVVGLGVFEAEPQFMIPVGGMVIGNAMTAAAVSLNRLGDEITGGRERVEALLALGATSTRAVQPLIRRSLRSGMITIVDSTKTAGLIFFPGTMVGMLLAGAEPTDAVRLQLILLYALLGSVAISALIATTIGYRGFFTAAHQLREDTVPPATLA